MTPVNGHPQPGDDPGDSPPSPLGYRGPTACLAARITYRQLDYWARTGLVEPTVREAAGSGTQRLYSRDDVVRLALVRLLLDAGLTVQVIRQQLHTLTDVGFVDVRTHDGGRTALRITLDPYAVAADVDDLLDALPSEPAEPPSAPPTLTVVP